MTLSSLLWAIYISLQKTKSNRNKKRRILYS